MGCYGKDPKSSAVPVAMLAAPGDRWPGLLICCPALHGQRSMVGSRGALLRMMGLRRPGRVEGQHTPARVSVPPLRESGQSYRWSLVSFVLVLVAFGSIAKLRKWAYWLVPPLLRVQSPFHACSRATCEIGHLERKLKEEQTNLCVFWTFVHRRSADPTEFRQPVGMRCEWVDIGTCPVVRFGRPVPGSGLKTCLRSPRRGRYLRG